LILFHSLSYNELASATIDQKNTMEVYDVADEKKRKRTMPRSSGGNSGGAPPQYGMIYTPPAG
jgi:hypothetical protein